MFEAYAFTRKEDGGLELAVDQFETKEEALAAAFDLLDPWEIAFLYSKKNRRYEHRFFAEGPELITRARMFIWGGR